VITAMAVIERGVLSHHAEPLMRVRACARAFSKQPHRKDAIGRTTESRRFSAVSVLGTDALTFTNE
jgi:hypothetical protein